MTTGRQQDELVHKGFSPISVPFLKSFLLVSAASVDPVVSFVRQPSLSRTVIRWNHEGISDPRKHSSPLHVRRASYSTIKARDVNKVSNFEYGKDVLNDKQDCTKIGTLTVPHVGIGTISWSPDRLTSLESQELEALVSEATTSSGAAPLFDTAERYGSNLKTAVGLGWGETEKLLRTLISNVESENPKDSSARQPIIATKFTPSPWRTTKESVVKACEQSCQRLGVDQIDLYQLHMPDIVQPLRFLGLGSPKDEVYWEGLAECYHRGLVKNIGVSNYGPSLIMRCKEALDRRGVPLASNQIAYSLIGRQNGAQETVDKCHELGIKVLAYYPFAMGLLTGKYGSNSVQMRAENALTSLTASKRSNMEMKDLNKYAEGDGKSIPLGGISPVLRALESIADKRNVSVAQVSLNYCICKGVVPIPGARTSAQLKDNLGALNWRLDEEEIAMLEYEADKLGVSFEGAGFKRTSEKFVGYGVERWALD